MGETFDANRIEERLRKRAVKAFEQERYDAAQRIEAEINRIYGSRKVGGDTLGALLNMGILEKYALDNSGLVTAEAVEEIKVKGEDLRERAVDKRATGLLSEVLDTVNSLTDMLAMGIDAAEGR